MRTRHFVAAPLVLAVIAFSATTASANIDTGTGGYSGGSTTGDGGQVVVAVPGSSDGGWSGAGYKGGGGGASNVTCGYFLVSGTAGHVLPDVGGPVTDTSTLDVGTLLWVICRDLDSGAVTFENIVTWDPAAPPPIAPPAVVLAQMAANSFRLPRPGVQTWPPTGSTGLVNLPVWLHVDNWAPVSASASAGGLSATVEAVPVRVVWNMDERSVTCSDAGSVYDVGSRPDPGSSSCAYTYRRSSGVNVDLSYHDSAIIVWHLRWSATNGEGGDLGELGGPPMAFDLQIEESQALIVPSNN